MKLDIRYSSIKICKPLSKLERHRFKQKRRYLSIEASLTDFYDIQDVLKFNVQISPMCFTSKNKTKM